MILLLTILVPVAQGALPQSYHVTPIQVPEFDVDQIWTAEINDRADVAVCGLDRMGEPIARLVSPWGSQNIEALFPGEVALVTHLAVNRRILGVSFSPGSMRPCHWDPTGTGHELRRISGGFHATPWDGTGDGWIVGESGTSISSERFPVVWFGGVLVTLDLPPGFDSGGCSAIDAKHRIVGWAGTELAWIRDGLGPPAMIGVPPGHSSSVLLDLHATWGGVGWTRGGGDHSNGMTWRDGVFTSLAPPSPYTGLWFAWINRQGTVLGHLDDRGYPDPVISDGMQLILLGDRLDLASSARYYPTLAFGVNDDGWILASCWDSQQPRSALCFLTPNVGVPAVPSELRIRARALPEQTDWLRIQSEELRERHGLRRRPRDR